MITGEDVYFDVVQHLFVVDLQEAYMVCLVFGSETQHHHSRNLTLLDFMEFAHVHELRKMRSFDTVWH